MVRLRGWPDAAKRSPIAASTASGQPRPLDELTVTTAPSGISAAASRGREYLHACHRLSPAPSRPRSRRSRSAALRTAIAVASDHTPSSPVAAGCALAAHGGVEQADRRARRGSRASTGSCSSPAAVRSSTSPTGCWVITSRAISEPSLPWTSKPVPANLVVNASWTWASSPERKRRIAHVAVLEPLGRHAGRLAHRHGLDRVVVEHEAQRVGIVDGDVERHAAAGLRAW